MTMFCEKCGTKLEAGDVFCPNCGHRAAPERPAGAYQQPPVGQPYQPAQPQSSGPKRSSGFKIAVVILAVLMAVEAVIAGIRYPGFFTGGGKEDTEAAVVTSDTDSDTADGEEREPDWKVPSLEDFDIDYTEEEISNAPKTEMQISNENRSASSGAFSVDFGNFNNMEDDTFTVRELPVHTFADANYRVRGFDLSLASGKDEFAGEVCVTLPRDESDGDLVQIVTKDPETGENTEEYFEISNDGSSYLLYTDHFSNHSVISILGDKLKEAVRSKDTSDPLARIALSAFYYKGYFGGVDSEVYYDPAGVRDKMSAAYLPSAFEMLQAMTEGTNPSKVGENAAKKDYSGLLLYDDDAAEAAGIADTALNIKTVTEALSTDKIIPGAEAAKKVGENLKLFGDVVGGISTVFSFKFAAGKAINDIGDGKYEDVGSAMWGNWSDTAGTAVSFVGLTGAALESYAAAAAAQGITTGFTVAAGTVGAPVAVAAAIAGLGIYCYSKSTKAPYDDMNQTELNYRQFYSSEYQSLFHTFVYDDKKAASGNDSVFNVRRLDCLKDDKLNKKFKKYFTSSYIYGQDTRSDEKKIDDCWMMVLKALYYTFKDEPDKLDGAVKEFYRNYCEAAWDYMDSDKGSGYLEFSKAAMKERGAASDAARLPNDGERKTFADNMYNELIVKHTGLFYEFAKWMTHSAQRSVDLMIRKQLVPLLNTQMEFTVRDASLSDPTDFIKSKYNAGPKKLKNSGGSKYKGKYKDVRQEYQPSMEFCIKDKDGAYTPVGPPAFLPCGCGYSEGHVEERVTILNKCDESYFFPVKTNFWPKLTDRNTVFRCTYYHYLMMGAPSAISFRDLNDKGAEVQTVDFGVPEAGKDGVIRINITVNDNGTQSGSGATLHLWKDPLCGYFDPESSHAGDYYTEKTPVGDSCTVNINSDGTLTLSVQGIDAEWKSVAKDGHETETETLSFSRASFTCSGKLAWAQVDRGVTLTEVYLVTACPSVSGTQTYEDKKEYTYEDRPDEVETKSTIETITMDDMKTSSPEDTEKISKEASNITGTEEFRSKYEAKSYVAVSYDATGKRIQFVTLHMVGHYLLDRRSDIEEDHHEDTPLVAVVYDFKAVN